MVTETQFDMFGGDPTVRRIPEKAERGPKAKQLLMFGGLNCAEGQMNLFADNGVPDELVNPEMREEREG